MSLIWEKIRFKDILWFAFTQKTLPKKTAYFFRGLIFRLFMQKLSRKASEEDESVSSSSLVGDDIYPLF